MNFFSNPVLMKELRGRMRGNRAMIIMTAYLSIIGLLTLLVYLATVNSMGTGNQLEAGRTIGKAIFLTVVITTLVQVCIITQSLTSGSIAGEKERQSYDFLISTLLSPWQIIVGKLGAALAFAVLLVLAVLPLAGLSFLFGGVSGMELTVAMVCLLVTAVLYAAIGIFWSTIMQTTLASTVMAQATIILPLLGVPFLFVLASTFSFSAYQELIGDLVNTPIFVYAVGAVLCAHPFIAFGLTEASLSAGENPFFFTIDPGRGDILVLSPWLVYTFIGLLLTAMFLVLSVRLLKPVQYGVPRTRKTEN